MLKSKLVQIVRETAKDNQAVLTRSEKFQVFCLTCDKLLDAGVISQIQHERWTEVF